MRMNLNGGLGIRKKSGSIQERSINCSVPLPQRFPGTRRCPTRDRILSWGLQTDPKCLYCNVGDESITHCFFECNFTWEIWKIIAAKCGFSSTRQWQALLLQLQHHPPNKVLKTLLLLCWQATLYTLWTERNNRLHNAHFSSSAELVRQIKLTVKNRASSLRIDRPKFSSSLLQLWFAT
ncbi:PREDICTED: uncharacterized protein LOC106303422 [Brassica oleracea var. oleracea]|nr:PREDICTED: uncharacterized protein LOC106303422 [Brassica oleracea var. oleracea]